MKKIFLTILITILFLTETTAWALSPVPPKVNFIFILSDDLGVMDIGCFNPKTFYETPHIDSIAKKGMRFMQGYAACPVCSPTRGSIMTGKYPPRFGITDYIGANRPGKLLPAPNKNHLELENITIAERLRDAGYSNFFAGKWHLGNDEFSPAHRGFPTDLVGKNQFFYPPGSVPNPKDDPKTTDRIADSAVKFIGENKNKPFFAYLPFLSVHIPVGARADLIAKYQKKKESAGADSWGQELDSKVRLVQNRADYAAMLEQMDLAIGRVLKAVDDAGIADRTVVIFMSDNGGLATAEGHPTSNLPLRGGKGWPYEGGVREPLIIFWPGVTTGGTTCDTPVISTDFFPTMLEMAGLPLNPKQHKDGVSLVPLLRNQSIADRPLFWHYPHYGNQGGRPFTSIREGDFKLIEWHEGSILELFNVKEDISEKNNLAKSDPARATKMHEKLIEWRKSVGALMPTPNPKGDEDEAKWKAKFTK